MLGVIIYSNLNPYFTELLHWINSICVRYGYSTIVHYPYNRNSEAEAINRILNRGVDGFLLNPVSDDASVLPVIKTLKLPYVLINRVFDIPGCHSVSNGDYSGAEQVMDHLLGLGHGRIAYVGFQAESSNPYSYRYQAYIDALGKAGIPLDERLVFWGNESGTPAYDAVQQFCSLSQRPTAIFCSSDLLAMELYRALYDRGFSLPDDISVVGFDDIDFAKYMRPSLTTVHQDMEKIAESILATILRLIQGKDVPEKNQIIPSKLIVRGSTSACSISGKREDSDGDN